MTAILKKDEYRYAFEIRNAKAHVTFYEPIISKEEKEKRMNELRAAVQEFWEDYYRREALAARETARASLS